MTKSSFKLLNISIADIERDIPQILALCLDYKPEYIEAIQPHILWLMKSKKFKLHPDGENTPTLESVHLNNGQHWYTYKKPSVRVLCKQYGHRMKVDEIRYEFKHIE